MQYKRTDKKKWRFFPSYLVTRTGHMSAAAAAHKIGSDLWHQRAELKHSSGYKINNVVLECGDSNDAYAAVGVCVGKLG